MSPILVRPVREQLEHDRVIRLLQQDLQKRKVEVGINPGGELNASIGVGSRKEYPDAVVYSLEKGKKVVAVVEVETGESVNHLEAMAQWAHFAKLRVPFHLYVPMGSVDVARRLSNDHKIPVTEIWSYHQVGEQFRFTLIHPPATGRGRAAAPAPRTVSVASIRVAPPPEPELPDEPAAQEPQATPASKGAPKVVSAKAKPSATAVPVRVAAPVKVVPAKAPATAAPASKAVAGKPATNGSQKASAPKTTARPVVSKTAPAPAKAPPPRAVISKAVKASAKAVTKATRPAPTPPPRVVHVKPAAKAKGRAAAPPVKAAKSAKPTLKPARAVRPAAKPARKALAKRK